MNLSSMNLAKATLCLLLLIPLSGFSQKSFSDNVTSESSTTKNLPFRLSSDINKYILDKPLIDFDNTTIIENGLETSKRNETFISSSFTLGGGDGVSVSTKGSYKNTISYYSYENESIAIFLSGGEVYANELNLRGFDEGKLEGLSVRCQVKHSLTKDRSTDKRINFIVNGGTPQRVPIQATVSVETNTSTCRTKSKTSSLSRIGRFGVNVRALKRDNKIPQDFIKSLCKEFREKSSVSVKKNFDIIVEESIYNSSDNYCRSDRDCPMPDKASILQYGLNKKSGKTLNKRECFIKQGNDIGLCRIVAKKESSGTCSVYRKGSDNKLYKTSGSFTRPCERGYICKALRNPSAGYSILSLIYNKGVDDGRCVKKPDHCTVN